MLNKKLKFFVIAAALAVFCSLNYAYAEKSANTVPEKANSGTLLPSKEENKNVFGRFLVTMGWVAGSCVVIYLILLVYKRRSEQKKEPTGQSQDMTLNLDSPQSIDEAVDFVIKKF